MTKHAQPLKRTAVRVFRRKGRACVPNSWIAMADRAHRAANDRPYRARAANTHEGQR